MRNDKPLDLEQIRELKQEFTRFMMSYKFAMDEVKTKIDILNQEFNYTHEYNPIEHVKTRLKTPESILKKVYRKGYELSLSSIKENIHDIAGIRIICSFVSDIYKISEMLAKQEDIQVIMCKDYIKKPKPNGYRSLHLVVKVPVFMSDRVENVSVEIQIRTIAMDFWASLEHKIYYKYDRDVPEDLISQLKEAAESAAELDRKMENTHKQVLEFKNNQGYNNELQELLINDERFHIPDAILKLFLINDSI
ncbi:MAG: GTP pyrophosphokinase family protein [Clostridiales bacterium]|nr:GTP pyrophosphokinase family protein [Clostridiales bacterium]